MGFFDFLKRGSDSGKDSRALSSEDRMHFHHDVSLLRRDSNDSAKSSQRGTTLGALRLGMMLDLNDPVVISRYKIRNVRSAVTNAGRPFKQFYFGPEPLDTKDLYISECMLVNGVVDCLMKTWLLSYQSEKDMYGVFDCLSVMFGKLYDEHLNDLLARTRIVSKIFNPSMERGVKAFPDSMAMAVQHALITSQQMGECVMARVIFCEENNLNTVYTLEFHPEKSAFQLSEVITFRN